MPKLTLDEIKEIDPNLARTIRQKEGDLAFFEDNDDTEEGNTEVKNLRKYIGKLYEKAERSKKCQDRVAIRKALANGDVRVRTCARADLAWFEVQGYELDEKANALLGARPDAPADEEKALEDMKKAELLALPEAAGIDPAAKKDEIIAAIKEARQS
jgi:hypothetical protein